MGATHRQDQFSANGLEKIRWRSAESARDCGDRFYRGIAQRRARVILMLADGKSYSTIEATVPCYRDYINRWRRRFLEGRLDGLRARYGGQPPTVLTAAMEARVLAKTQQPPPDGSTHWSTRKLGRVLGIHHNLVAKTWQRAGLQPHRFERYMQSDDPDFESKAADVDEKTAIQALDRASATRRAGEALRSRR